MSGQIIQNGYVVDDLDATIAHWVKHTGIGPWTVFRGVTLDGRYRGEETSVTFDVAMGYTGELQVELMHITSTTPSPYADENGTPKLGPHHVAWLSDDLDASVAEATGRGLEVLFRAGNEATQVAYLESPDHPGLVFEYIQGPMMREMLAAGIAAARDWDGTNPVQELG
ncbi:VOC family protein [Gordonia neofelifaecis]|uniref:VOC domain-containing protein n=1 Tax=Gordonia neofelifaecis NRRL B-59395 TaxID=644548 RepID=F1YPF3_9ACTN|nr:VOC family protein [Gordonia neofelifaecis]EGD53404.1 hypothetical protein SCNU_19040 [Gordonia neofelifaecis NRRL B-59395]